MKGKTMRSSLLQRLFLQNLLLPFAMLAALSIGCGQQPAGTGAGEHAGHSHADHEVPAGHTHEHTVNGWCVEHSVPEDDCTQCSKEAAEKHKKAGDWCAEHNRAESQCFICNPKKEAEFAAQYKAQFGEDLPKPHKH